MHQDTPENLSFSLSNNPGRALGITVGIESYRGKLRLRVPAKLLGRERYIYTKLDDNDDGRKQAQKQAWAIEEDVVAGKFADLLDVARWLWQGAKDHDMKLKPYVAQLEAQGLNIPYSTAQRYVARLPE